MRRLRDWLTSHEGECADFLQSIIRIPSVTGNEGPIQAFIAEYMSKLGLSVDRFVPSLEELRQHPAYVDPPRAMRAGPMWWRSAGEAAAGGPCCSTGTLT